ncbi:MAG TPA: 2Fe-2S iron-sulfur cluster-binding protein [Stellaceae bacterium]|nr:2Fe-2S iron-sulfur cluster-binding protein [Stellaceae bacterium]
MKAISLNVNGRPTSATVEPRRHLADFLRENCLLTGTHLGCEHGVCGACTVLLDGQPVRSCITLAVAADGATVQTIEGLEDDPIMVRLRAAFTREHALQCGYCTPGMLMTARDIALRLPAADAARVRLELSGNLCRCTGYVGIVRAIGSVLRDPETTDAAVPRAALPSRPQLSRLASAASASPLVATAAVTTGEDGAATTLRQTVRIAIPRAEVWAAIKNPAVIVACVPGAELTPSDAPGRVAGRMTVALGPVRAHFAGAADVSYDDEAWRGILTGHGQDRATGTRLHLEARFRVAEEGSTASVVELSVDYGLRGPLAQFSRSGIVELVAEEVVRQAARNLEARLSGGGAAVRAPLGLGRILLKLLSARLAAVVGRVRAQWRDGR